MGHPLIVGDPPAAWAAYAAARTVTHRNRVVECYLPVVGALARQTARRLPRVIATDPDDLASAGAVGLVQAVEGFDPRRQVRFLTYASRRIRGAMMDHLRGLDPIARSARSRGGGRKVLRLQEKIASTADGQPATLGETLVDRAAADPAHIALCRDLVAYLLRQLPPSHQRAVRMYDLQGHSMLDTGRALGITSSGASMLRKAAFRRLRKADGKQKPELQQENDK